MDQLEGQQSVLAALQARQRRFQIILLSTGAHEEKLQEVLGEASAQNIPIRRADPKELDAMAHGRSHGGLIALCSPKPRMAVKDLLAMVDSLKEPAMLLLLEGVDDARNLAFTLRSAEALGAHAVLIKKHLWDFDTTDVARSSSGAYERLPLVQIEDIGPLQQLQKRGLQLYGCLANVNRTVYNMDLRQPIILAIGGEKRGLSGAVRDICDQFITIPTLPGAASLSLSHAAAICLAEAHRQRISINPQS